MTILEEAVEGVVERIVAGGWGLVRGGRGVVFARGVLPGERVRLTDIRRKKGTAFARAALRLEDAPGRTSPGCGYSTVCGGCDFQHATYEAEREAKREMLRDALRRIARAEIDVAEVVPSPSLDARASARMQGGGGHIGYFARETNDLVPIESCPVLAPPLRAAFPSLLDRRGHGWVRTLLYRTDGTHVLARSTGPKRWEEAWIGEAPPDGRLHYRIAGREFLVSPTSFFQVNPAIAGRLVEFAGEALLPGPATRLWDLYAGVGLFGLALAEKYERVLLLEISRSSLADAKENAERLAPPGRVEVETWDAGRGLPKDVLPSDDVILDPPRVGMAEKLTEDLLARGPRRILLIECDLASFARDFGRLAAAYRPAGPVRPFDMFPRTAHLEAAVLLVRAAD